MAAGLQRSVNGRLCPRKRPFESGFGTPNRFDKRNRTDNLSDPEIVGRYEFKRIGAGLANLGNTCFLNSVLQCLTYTEPLAAYFLSGRHKKICNASGFCAMCAIQNHVMNALASSGKILAPSHLVKNIRCISRNFRLSRQEDAHEYMVQLMESLHKCSLPSGIASESPSAYEKSLVHKIFGGRLRSRIKCPKCSYGSNTFEPFLDLSLQIMRCDSLWKALSEFTAVEQLEVYNCEQCKKKVQALKQLTVDKAPHILAVHLKRFNGFTGEKINKKVEFGRVLDLKPFMSNPQEGDSNYTLYGVLVHAGHSTQSGHYYCFIRTSTGIWHALDDNRVYQVNEKVVLTQKAYMLFYVRNRKALHLQSPKGENQGSVKFKDGNAPCQNMAFAKGNDSIASSIVSFSKGSGIQFTETAKLPQLGKEVPIEKKKRLDISESRTDEGLSSSNHRLLIKDACSESSEKNCNTSNSGSIEDAMQRRDICSGRLDSSESNTVLDNDKVNHNTAQSELSEKSSQSTVVNGDFSSCNSLEALAPRMESPTVIAHNSVSDLSKANCYHRSHEVIFPSKTKPVNIPMTPCDRQLLDMACTTSSQDSIVTCSFRDTNVDNVTLKENCSAGNNPQIDETVCRKMAVCQATIEVGSKADIPSGSKANTQKPFSFLESKNAEEKNSSDREGRSVSEDNYGLDTVEHNSNSLINGVPNDMVRTTLDLGNMNPDSGSVSELRSGTSNPIERQCFSTQIKNNDSMYQELLNNHINCNGVSGRELSEDSTGANSGSLKSNNVMTIYNMLASSVISEICAKPSSCFIKHSKKKMTRKRHMTKKKVALHKHYSKMFRMAPFTRRFMLQGLLMQTRTTVKTKNKIISKPRNSTNTKQIKQHNFPVSSKLPSTYNGKTNHESNRETIPAHDEQREKCLKSEKKGNSLSNCVQDDTAYFSKKVEKAKETVPQFCSSDKVDHSRPASKCIQNGTHTTEFSSRGSYKGLCVGNEPESSGRLTSNVYSASSTFFGTAGSARAICYYDNDEQRKLANAAAPTKFYNKTSSLKMAERTTVEPTGCSGKFETSYSLIEKSNAKMPKPKDALVRGLKRWLSDECHRSSQQLTISKRKRSKRSHIGAHLSERKY